MRRLPLQRLGLLLLTLVLGCPTFAQSPYEIIELKLPDEPDAPLIFTHLNNAGQIAGGFNRVGGELFIARWEPGKTNLTEVRLFRPDDFDAPPGVTLTGVRILALYHSGDGLIALTGVKPLNPHQRHPLTQRSYAQKGYTRVMHYSAGTLHTIKEFETWGGLIATTAFSETGNGKFIFCEYGGDDYYTRFPADDSGFSWNEHLPHYPEVWKLSDLSGSETLLNTDIDVLNLPTDYRYETRFNHMDALGNIYALAIFRTHPLTSFGRPVTGARQEVWVQGQPRTLTDYAGSAAGAILISHVNRDGEITGLFGPLSSRNVALYLPRANYGRVAGAHTITTSDDAYAVSRVNRQGAMVWAKEGSRPGIQSIEGMLWSTGTNRSLDSLIPPGSVPHPLSGRGFQLQGSALLNDQGWILTSSRNPDPLAAPDFRYWLMRPVQEAEAFLSTNRVSVGDTFTFTLRVRNHTSTPRTLGLPIGFRFTGDARFQLVGASTPPGARVVPAFGSFEVQQLIRATNAGTSTWHSQGRLFSGGTSNDTALAYSESLRVLDRADLLIKRAEEPDSAYGVDNEYQTMPAGPQVRSNSVLNTQLSQFHIRVQNDDTRPRTFRLTADEGLNLDGWEVQHLLNGVDASATIRAGHLLPELAAGQSHEVTLQVISTNAPPGEPKRVLYTLEESSEPGEIRDVVEAVTELGSEIIVNSTGDEADADPLDGVADVDLNKPDLQTTLRAAIELANQRPGKDLITFDIQPEGNTFEDGVPTFHPESALPDVTDPVTIDGWSQDPDASHPPVQLGGLRLVRPERDPQGRIRRLYDFDNQALWPDFQQYLLDWPGAASGLHLVAGESEVRGLVINHFPLCGILVDGPNNTIQGNYLGIDPSGQRSRGNGYGATDGGVFVVALGVKGADLAVRSPGNLIGGPGPREGNVISGRSGQPSADAPGAFVPSVTSKLATDRYGTGSPLILISGAAAIGNRIQGNILGLTATGDGLAHPEKVHPWFEGPLGGVFEYLSSGTVIGGSAPGEGNVVAGNAIDILSGNRCSILGNIVGANRTITRPLPAEASRGGIAVSGESPQVGDQEPGASNAVLSGGISLIGATNAVVRANRIGIGANGLSFPNPIDGIEVAASHASIIDGNWVTRRERGIVLSDSQAIRVSGNTISNNLQLGILVQGGQNSVITQNHVVENGRSGSNPAGIRITQLGDLPPPQRIHITQNSITDNHGFGISFQPEDTTRPAPTENDHGDSDSGPNSRLNHPQLANAIQAPNGVLHATGGFGSRLGQHPYLLEFFASPKASPTGFGEGATFLESLDTVTDLAGQSTFSLSVAAPNVVGQYLTATATDTEANTSEFSPAILIQGELQSDPDGISDEIELQVPNRVPQAGRAIADFSTTRNRAIRPHGPEAELGDGNGDNLLDAQQTHVTSFPTLTGNWLTLTTTPEAILTDVTPTAQPDFNNPPLGYTFPLGFVSLTLSNLPPGATVTLTNILHSDQEVTTTTAFTFGPTTSNSQPHWFELHPTIVANEIHLHLTDGATGDLDLSTNGSISTLYALAYPIPPGPTLTLLSLSREMVTQVTLIDTNGAWSPVTNVAPQVTTVLAWPTTSTNHWLEASDILSPTSAWHLTPDEPAVSNGLTLVTNVSLTPHQLFRLRRF